MVFSDADLDLAAGACAKGAFVHGPALHGHHVIIVMEDVADAFVAKVLEHAQAKRAGHPLDEATTMGPSVSDGRSWRRCSSTWRSARVRQTSAAAVSA